MIKNEELIRKLRDAGCKSTPTRVVLLKIFSKAHKPITTTSLLAKIKGVDTATIYRNLISLQKIGLIRKVDLQKKDEYYELNMVHHHHIICRECGVFEDFKLCHIDAITKKTLNKSTKFRSITDHSLEFYGICNTCVK